jgi:hypothetical protein
MNMYVYIDIHIYIAYCLYCLLSLVCAIYWHAEGGGILVK